MRNRRSQLDPCERVSELAASRRRGDGLTPEDQAFISDHLRRCARCRLDSALSGLLAFSSPADSPAPPLDELSRRRRIEDLVRAVHGASLPQEGGGAPDLESERRPGALAGSPAARRWWSATPRGARWVVAASLAALVVGVAWMLAARIWRAPAPEPSRPPTSRVLLASGVVRVDGVETQVGGPLREGSLVHVEAGQAVLALPEGAKVWLQPGTRLRVDRLAPADVSLSLAKGEILASVTPTRRPRRFGVRTPGGRVLVHGTIFAVEATSASTQVHVMRGEVRVEGTRGEARPVRAGGAVRVRAGKILPMALPQTSIRRHAAALRVLSVLADQGAARVTVRSLPPGALVLVDGTPVGHTPLVAEIRPGDRVLTVRSPGRAPIREQVALRPAGRLRRTFELTAARVRATSLGARGPVGAQADLPSPPRDVPLVLSPAVLRAGPRPGARQVGESISALLARARAARGRRAWAEAAAAYEALLARHGATSQGWTARVALGLLLLRHLGRPASALRRFNEYLLARPRGGLAPEAAFGRARALRRLGRARLEREALEAFLRRYPKAAQASLARARLRVLARPAGRAVPRPEGPQGGR